MAVTVMTRPRSPRGTKVLTNAFFAALDDVPEPQRAAVAKAALAGIRDELKAQREKTRSLLLKGKVARATAASAARKPRRASKNAA